MEYFSALKRNELSSHDETWGKQKCILLSERNQSEKAIFCMIPTIGHFAKGKTMGKVRRAWFSRDKGGMNRRSTEDFQSELYSVTLQG